LLRVIGDTTENRILDFLIEGMSFDYSKKHIADNCKISRPTLYRILPRLVKERLVKPTRKIGAIQLYAINRENERIRALMKLEGMLLNQSFEEIEAKAIARTGGKKKF
ncbi:MAG: helix-turn-helix domain-containing protein, partial [archaeon]